MPKLETTDRQRTYLPSLEGLRAYAFLPVFLAHYFPVSLFPYHSSLWLLPMSLAMDTAWLAVPIFFVLSGYLIGGILYDTRDRVGYFKVFYSRRILRVFPVYYITLLVVAYIDLIHGVPLNYNYWSHFLYIQNLLPGYTGHLIEAPSVQTIHFWSLAVEEQFYLTWPLVVWLCRDRRTLLRVTALLIVLCCVVRLLSPWMHLSTTRCYFLTPTRVDAILLGVVLALVRHGTIYKRLEPFAKFVALAGVSVMIITAIWTGHTMPGTYLRVALQIPCVNLTAAAIIIAVMERGSLFCRICSARWACWLGSLSYGLYVFHLTYAGWFLKSFEPRLAVYMPRPWAFIASAAVAFCLTLALAVLSYRFVEQPAMNLKKRLKYGPVRNQKPLDATEPSLANCEV
ncbi:MAG: acyltransferase [Terracidiphilus sp.]|jgi:peptidoglycan/LPS O-acetylase OafA/YrhL